MPPLSLTRAQAHYIRQLKDKKYRWQTRAFLVEGRKSVQDLLRSDYVTELMVATPSFMEAAQEMVADRAVPLYTASPTLLARLSALKKNHHVLAVAKMKPNNPLHVGQGQQALVLDTIKDPGNLGTIMRIADWYGIPKLICSPTTVDRYNLKVIQSSMGSFTQVQSYYTPLEPFLAKCQVPVIGAVVESKHYAHTTPLPQQGLLVIGNESQGIHPSLRPYLTTQVAIQPHGKADSLNAAMATAILCERWCQAMPSP